MPQRLGGGAVQVGVLLLLENLKGERETWLTALSGGAYGRGALETHWCDQPRAKEGDECGLYKENSR